MKQILLSNDKLAEVMADFMNGVMGKSKTAYETAVGTLKSHYGLKPEQEAMVRIALTHLEMMAPHVDEEKFDLRGFVALNLNILSWIIAEDYDHLNKSVLRDVTIGN